MTMPTRTLAEIADLLGLPVPAQAAADRVFEGVAPLETAGREHVAVLGEEKYVRHLATTAAGLVLIGSEVPRGDARPPEGTVTLEVADPGAATSAVLALFAPKPSRPTVGVHLTAVVAQSAVLGRDVAIGPNVIIGERVTLGHGCILHAGAVIGDDCTLGDGCELFPHVVVRERCVLGMRVTLHPNATIGADGFGYRWDGRQHAKVPHIGTVVIEDDVEIGANSCVDRAKFGETRIGAGSKIDNLVQIAHNCRLGRLCVVAANVGIAGSTVLGDGVIIGGGAGLRDHIRVGAGVRIGAYSGVVNDVPAGQTVVGLPALPQRDTLREQAALRTLPDLIKRVRQLEKRLGQPVE